MTPSHTSVAARWRRRRPTTGVVVWLVQRLSALALLVVVPLKILSGWAMVGAIDWGDSFARLHTNSSLDVIVVGAVAFHALFGLRTLLIDAGLITIAKRLTWPLAIAAVAATAWSVAVVT